MDKKTKPSGKKRPYGDGSVYQRSDGRWESIIHYIDPETGEKKKKSFYGKGPKEVLGKKKAFEEELKSGISPTTAKTTLNQWLDKWLETYARVKVRQNTYEDYKRIVDGHLKPALGSVPVKNLRPDQVQKMLNEKLAGGRQRDCGDNKKGGHLSPRTVELIFTVLHSALGQALKNGLVTRNVCDAVDKPKKVKTEFIPWTTEQSNYFLSSVKDSRLFPVYMVAWGAGLRRSEIVALRWSDIDLKNGTLSVRQSLVRVKDRLVFQEPKTTKSRRTVTLPASVTKELKSWKARQAQEEMNWRAANKHLPAEEIPKYNPLNLVFCNEVGEPMNPDFITRSFKKDLVAAKLPAIRFHDLRHGHATMLLELGEDIKVISERLGHSSIAMTGDIYTHVREQIQRRASNKLDEVLDLRK